MINKLCSSEYVQLVILLLHNCYTIIWTKNTEYSTFFWLKPSKNCRNFNCFNTYRNFNRWCGWHRWPFSHTPTTNSWRLWHFQRKLWDSVYKYCSTDISTLGYLTGIPELKNYSGDLNNGEVRYSDGPIIKWSIIQALTWITN